MQSLIISRIKTKTITSHYQIIQDLTLILLVRILKKNRHFYLLVIGALKNTIHIKKKFDRRVFIYLLIQKSYLLVKDVTKGKLLNYETIYAQELFIVVITKYQLQPKGPQ